MTYKWALLTTVVAAAASTAHATTYYNAGTGDLLVGFTSAGAANDYILDIGGASGLSNGEQWTLGDNVGGTFSPSQFAAARWGVIGALNSSKTIYSTTDGSFTPNEAVNYYQTIRADVATLGANSTVGNFTTPANSATALTSWYGQTAVPINQNPSGIFETDFYNPNVSTSSSAFLYANPNNGGAPTLLGDFTISSDGNTLTFVAVPEPATYGLLGSFGVLALSLRRQLRKA